MFILVRHAGKCITAGVNEVHRVFYNLGRFDFHPNDMERTRRESINNSGVHEHVHIDNHTKHHQNGEGYWVVEHANMFWLSI